MTAIQLRPTSYELKDIKQQAKKLDGQELFDYYCKTVSHYQHTIEGNDGDRAIEVIYDSLKGIVEDKGYSMDDLGDYHMATSQMALFKVLPTPIGITAKALFPKRVFKRLGFDPSSVIEIQSEHIKTRSGTDS